MDSAQRRNPLPFDLAMVGAAVGAAVEAVWAPSTGGHLSHPKIPEAHSASGIFIFLIYLIFFYLSISSRWDSGVPK